MAFENGAHGYLDDIPFKLDEAAPDEIQRPAYRHYARSLFRQGLDITGKPGAKNLREERLMWHITDWDGGEGQVVLNDSEDSSARRFYRSEGLDFRVPGQVTLNKSSIPVRPADGTATATTDIEGSAFSDVTGTSVTVNTTDQRLAAVADVIESSSFTPGAVQANVAVLLYKEAAQTTSIAGSSFLLRDGDGAASGTDFYLKTVGSMAQSTALSSLGTDAYSVNFTVNASGLTTKYFAETKLLIVDTTGDREDVVASTVLSVPYTTTATLTWTPVTGRTYRARVRWLSKTGSTQKVIIDAVTHGKVGQPTTVTVFARNHTDSNTTGLPTKTVQLQNTSTAHVVNLNWTATAAKAYRIRVQYDSGQQRPVVDKITHNASSTGAWILDAMELGGEGKTWLVGHQGSGDNQTWTWDEDDAWTLEEALDQITATASVTTHLAHTASWEYGLDAGGEVSKFSTTVDDDYTAAITGAVGLSVCQDRLFVLQEHATNGVDLSLYALDGTASDNAATSTAAVTGALISPDTTLRQRMVGTPTGARFFVNFGGVDCVIYEADSSGSSLTVRELQRLDVGAKATAITHVAGHTFVAGQFLAESGQTPRSALWVIYPNGVIDRVGYFRRDDPNTNRVQYLQPYQNDLWCLQGPFVWRYSLTTGGLFLEYELSPGLASNAKSLAVVQGHVIVLYSGEDATNTGGVTWITGSVGTYRPATVADGNSFTTSIYDYGLPGVKKMFSSATVVTDDMPADTSVLVEYQLDQDGTWTPAGTHTENAESRFQVSTPLAQKEFRTLQLRVTLSSHTGVNTPTLKAVIIEALPAEFEEFFDLMVLTEHEDSGFRVAEDQREGGIIAQDLIGLWRTGSPVSFEDGYASSAMGNNPSYICRIDDIDLSNDQLGEGRMMVRLRILD